MHNKRDKQADRESGKDRDHPGEKPPTGTAGPSGTTIDKNQGAGGAIEPDPPEDRG